MLPDCPIVCTDITLNEACILIERSCSQAWNKLRTFISFVLEPDIRYSPLRISDLNHTGRAELYGTRSVACSSRAPSSSVILVDTKKN